MRKLAVLLVLCTGTFPCFGQTNFGVSPMFQVFVNSSTPNFPTALTIFGQREKGEIYLGVHTYDILKDHGFLGYEAGYIRYLDKLPAGTMFFDFSLHGVQWESGCSGTVRPGYENGIYCSNAKVHLVTSLSVLAGYRYSITKSWSIFGSCGLGMSYEQSQLRLTRETEKEYNAIWRVKVGTRFLLIRPGSKPGVIGGGDGCSDLEG